MSGALGEADGGNGQVHRKVASHAVVLDEHVRTVHRRFIHRVVNQIAGVAEIEIDAAEHERVWRLIAPKIRGIDAVLQHRYVPLVRVQSIAWSRVRVSLRGWTRCRFTASRS